VIFILSGIAQMNSAAEWTLANGGNFSGGLAVEAVGCAPVSARFLALIFL
jgi:hypothetical protein